MAVLNQIDRFQLTFDAIRRVPRLNPMVTEAEDRLSAQLQRHKAYVMEHGEDLPEVQNWKWTPWQRG
jgi:xylulose-5-phosphate/fructose-6-phosphate phosphoketolase